MRPSRAPVPAPVVLAATLVVAALLAACTSSGGGSGAAGSTTLPSLPEPAGTVPGAAPSTVPPTLPVPEGFVAPDTRGVYLRPVESRFEDKIDHTKPLLPVRGGKAELRGVVFGPDGPLEGATVRLERFVGIDFGILDVGTDADGEWEATELLGGRYRVRAWQTPTLATIEPQATFLKEDGSAELALRVEKHEGTALQGAIDTAEPAVGQELPFRALLTTLEVDDAGIVQGKGVPAAEVALIPIGGGWRVIGETTATTDAEGFAAFTVMCTRTGVHPVVIRSGDVDLAMDLPECLAGELPSEAPPTVDFPVGRTFTPPTDGPLPPGTYVSSTPGQCGTSFEEWTGAGGWVRRVTFERGLVFGNPVRDLRTLPQTTACTFRRES